MATIGNLELQVSDDPADQSCSDPCDLAGNSELGDSIDHSNLHQHSDSDHSQIEDDTIIDDMVGNINSFHLYIII